MTTIEDLLRQPAAQAIGWALLQFMWQGALVGAVAAAALYALRRGAADVRYVVAAIGLSLMLTMPAVTALQAWQSMSEAPRPADRGLMSAPSASSPAPSRLELSPPLEMQGPVAGAVSRSTLGSPLSSFTLVRAILLVWLTGVIFLTLRLLAGWLWVQRLQARGSAPAPAAWQQTAAKLAKRLHIARPIRLLESAMVEVPTVIGWLRPVVLMPASALSGMGPLQLEAILAHELAHIRRHDYLVNLLQTLVETLLFYHPAVWWLSGRIRIERENCCDDLAVSLCGDPYTYARALADLEELRADSSRLVLAATGGSLVHRVRRLVGAPSHAGRRPGWLAGSTAVVLIAGIAAGAVGTNALGSEQADAPQTIVPPPPMTETSAPVLAPSQSSLGRAPAIARSAPQPPVVAGAARVATSPPAETSAPVIAEAPLGEAVASFVANVLDQFLSGAPPVPPAPPAPPSQPAPPSPRNNEVRSMVAPAAPAPPSPPTPATPATPPTPPTPATLPTPPPPPLTPAMPATLPMAAPPGQPDVPAPPAPPEPFAGIGQSRGNFMWSDGKQKLEIKYDGTVEFKDDDSDVQSMSPGGLLRIREVGSLGSRTVEFQADASGTIRRRYWEGLSEKPFDPDGRAWLSQALPRIIRQTAIGAPGRVARILKAKGPAGVLAEVALIEGSWGKRAYFSELLKSPGLDSTVVRQTLDQAGRQIDSDFELARLLIAADRLLVDDGTRRAYFDAARTIQSDFEMRRVYASALKRGPEE